ncbi:lecithin retinol acyltransferase family protein [uncultured Clostridium sp.]|uniref:lecithin retinol acyltransferase family protein n=1 Tax=uncultured Clostridium sp. TaxID=59620 RepID=UPI0025F8935E|nr:lecithin retinol acyltransferase family protein [uncultured Clostridium sp.]
MKKFSLIKLISIFIITAVAFSLCWIYIYQNREVNIYKYSQIQIPLKGKIVWNNSNLKNISVKYKNNDNIDVYIFPGANGRTLLINPPMDGFLDNSKINVTLSTNLHFKNYKLKKDKKLCFKVNSDNSSKLSKIMRAPKYGDIVGTTDNFLGYKYNHYGIYIGNNRVIHYCSNTSSAKDARIRETDMTPYFRPENYFILNVKSNVEFNPGETVRRAKTRLGERSYNLLQNNCEHFALWAKTGNSRSYQLDNLSQEELAQIKIFTAMGINLQ